MSFEKVKDFVSNNKKKVIAGTVLVVGGTVLYYLAKQRGTVLLRVEKYTTLEDAIASLAVYVENEKDAAVIYEKGLFTVMDL